MKLTWRERGIIYRAMKPIDSGPKVWQHTHLINQLDKCDNLEGMLEVFFARHPQPTQVGMIQKLVLRFQDKHNLDIWKWKEG